VWVANIFRQYLGPNTTVGGYIRRLGLGDDTLVAYGSGTGVVLLVIFTFGVIVQSGARRVVSRLFDGLFARLPLIGPLYGTSKQLVALFEAKDNAAMKGMRVVLCTFGDVRGAGVLALLVSPQVYRLHGRDYLVVIIPTAPVPIGGGLLLMPRESVLPTDLTLDAFMSIYVSMGVTMPQFIPPADVPPKGGDESVA
jgi:uncharacterized membrane protein